MNRLLPAGAEECVIKGFYQLPTREFDDFIISMGRPFHQMMNQRVRTDRTTLTLIEVISIICL